MWNIVSLASESATTPPDDRVVGSDRVLAVLTELARHSGGVSLDELARVVTSPKPTVHRALVALRKAGFADQDGRGRYLLGDEFLRLAFTHHEARPDHLRVQPVLDALANRFHETAHYAVLDDDWIVYRSKVDPPTGAVKLTSVIGGRNPVHCTAVGKLMLAYTLPDEASVRPWLAGKQLAQRTDQTITDPDAFVAELAQIRTKGYSVDDQENEAGVNCVAVPVFLTSSSTPIGAISVSGLTYRTPLATLVDAVDEMRSIVATRFATPAS